METTTYVIVIFLELSHLLCVSKVSIVTGIRRVEVAVLVTVILICHIFVAWQKCQQSQG